METPTPETPKTKEELFKENPDRFVNADDIIICIMRSPEGPRILCNPATRAEAVMARGDCDIALFKTILSMDAQSRKITPAPGGIMNFAKRFKH
jgi:hypothetical protein